MDHLEALLFLLALVLQTSWVEPVIECTSSGKGCSLESYLRGPWLDAKPCNVLKVFYPTTESELVQAVAYAVQHKLKVKVVSKNAHTFTRFACPGGSDGTGVLVSTSRYNSSMTVDHERMTATADGGVQIRQFVDWLAGRGVALEQTTFWDGVSVAGMIGTGAHGTGLWGSGGGTVEYVVGIRLVVPASQEEGYAKVVTLTNETSELFHAARISLGTLGAVSQVTFAVQPLFKRAATNTAADDENFEDQVLALPRAHEFVDIYWYPSTHKYVARTDDRVSYNTPGDGALVAFLPVKASVIRQARELEELQEATGNTTTYCAAARTSASVSNGGPLTNDGRKFTGYPVVGYNHKLQTSGGCQYVYDNETNLGLPAEERLVCRWDYEAHGLFWYHISVFVPLTKVSSLIRDVKALREAVGSSSMCMIDSYLGIEFRFVKASEAFLGNREDSAVVEFVAFRDRNPGQPQRYGHIVEEIEQMLVYKYGGKPHFGKNRPHAFTDVKNKVRNTRKFIEARKKMDPEGWFSSEWSDAVLGIRGSPASYRDGCALDGLCVCREDRHCSPEKGYLCRSGTVYKNARVCAK